MSQSGYHNGQLIYPVSVVDHKKTTENPVDGEIKELQDDVSAIEGKIPEEASSSNKLADKSYVGTETTGMITSEDVTTIVVISESDYEQLTDKDANTLYCITESA